MINKFLEIEDTGTYHIQSKDKMYEQTLKNLLDELTSERREKVLEWCEGVQ